MSDSVKKYHELMNEDKLMTSEVKRTPSNLTPAEKQQAFRLLAEYDAKIIKYAFNQLMFG